MRMNELTDSERDFLDRVNIVNQKYCKDPEQSLWNVCKGYLNGEFNSHLLDFTDSEIESILRKVNSNSKPIVRISAVRPSGNKEKKPTIALF